MYYTTDDWPDSSEIIESTKTHAIPSDIEKASLVNAMKWKLIGTCDATASKRATVTIPSDDLVINELNIIAQPTQSDVVGSYVFNVPFSYLQNTTGTTLQRFKQGAYYSSVYYSECIVTASTNLVELYSLALTNGSGTIVKPTATLHVYYR